MILNHFRIGNGTHILFINTTNTKIATVGVFVNTGSAKEVPEENGISHFLEHMAFKGTKRRSYQKISSEAEILGAEMNAFTDREMTGYFITGLSDHVPSFVDILGDIFCNSIFPEDEIEKEKQVILQEMKMYEDQPSYVAYDQLYASAFQNQAFGRKIIGTPETVLNMTQADFQAYMSKYYHTGNVVIAVCGDINEDSTLAHIEKAFKKLLKTKPPASEPVYSIPVFTNHKAVTSMPVKQCSVYMAYGGPGTHSPVIHAFDVAAAVIGDGMSSPLFVKIREEQGLAYHVSAHYSDYRNVGLFTVSAGLDAQSLPKFFSTYEEILLDTAAKVSKKDLTRAKNLLSVSLAKSAERPFNVMLDAVSDIFAGVTITQAATIIQEIQAVTAGDVQDVLVGLSQVEPTVSVVGKGIKKDALKDIFDQK